MSCKWHACKEKFAPYTYALLRIVVGLILVAHGFGKVTDLPKWTQQLTDMGFSMPQVNAYLSVAGEFLGGLGLLVGLFTPIAAFGAACVMAAAIFCVHFSHGLFLQNGGFEYPLVLFAAALFFMTHGGGKLSLDALWCKHQGECAK